jgi:hypothetical protein
LLDNLNLKMTVDVIKGKIVGKEQSIKTVLSSKVISKKDSNNI